MSDVVPFPEPSSRPRVMNSHQEELSRFINDCQIVLLYRPVAFRVVASFMRRLRTQTPEQRLAHHRLMRESGAPSQP